MSLSRRTFIGTLAALPLATRAIAQGETPPHVAVIGAGAFGGWTALHLLRMGAQVTLIDAWGAGNARSSSGGETRVIRAIYGQDRPYVEMVRRAFELWAELDATTDETLYTETGALWMHRGDDAYVRSSLPILKELGFPVDVLSVDDASKRYPHIDYRGVRSLYFERRAGALSARRACMAVRDAFTKAGGTFRIGNVTPEAIKNDAMPALRISDGTALFADAYVFACGPWLGKLFPEILGDIIRPTRQEVYYFGVPRGSQNYMPANFPVWIDFGERIFYGIPDVAGRGFKIADDTRGETIDPTTQERTPTADGIARARNLLAERFPELLKAPLISAEVCQYENSPDGHLIIDRHPQAKNVWLIGGGSGHGFKLSPAVGEMTAQHVLTGKEVPKLFHLDRLRDATKPKTQFDRG
jgi:monomeric sarcosine oxidase